MLSTDNIILLLKFVITSKQIKSKWQSEPLHVHNKVPLFFSFTKKAYTRRFKFCFNFLVKLALSMLIWLPVLETHINYF